jgi:PAS domain S-box-containing protein
VKTILIVDDIENNLYLLKKIFEGEGYNVIEAKNGKEGLKKLYSTKVNMIISDILMPVMDGYLFCQACKKEKLFKKIPFVFYTATYTDVQDEDFALKLGAAKFIRKPCDYSKLLIIVEDIFDNIKSQKKYIRKVRIGEEEVLKLYSERLINKLEQKNAQLEKEISDKKHYELVLKNENQILNALAKNTPLNKIFDKIIKNFEALNDGYFGSISLLSNNENYLDLVSAPNLPLGYNKAVEHISISKNSGSCGTASYLKKPVIVSDIHSDKLWEDYRELALKYNLKSCWSTPILSTTNTILGTFAIYSNAIRHPSVQEIKELSFAVNLAKIAIEKEENINEIKKREVLYRALIEQASDAIILYGFDGTIYDFNHTAYNSLGYTRDEFKQLTLNDLIKGEIVENSDNFKKIEQGMVVTFNRRFLHKNKNLLDVEITSKLQNDGKILGMARDITERKKAERVLKEKNKELIKTNNELDRFVYSASHDLRAPLTSLRGLIQMSELSLNPNQSEVKDHFYLMSKTINKMDMFINDILNYSKNSRLVLNIEKIDFEDLIESCLENLKYRNFKNNPKITVKVNQKIEFFSDKARLEIILYNLISNALKYYDSSKNEHVVVIAVKSDKKKVIVNIEDNGIGIDKEHINKIFDMFYRATKFSSGSGMGMYIVKETIDKLHGFINVESVIEKGTKFTFSIPNSN